MKGILEINYEENEMLGLPGPHLFFWGDGEAFNRFSYLLQDLMEGDVSIDLGTLDFVKVINTNKPIIFSSSSKGHILSQILEDKFYTNLDHAFWRELFIQAVRLSRGTQSTTVECIDVNGLRDAQLIENCGMIWEC